jgi:cell volume regulation protein A
VAVEGTVLALVLMLVARPVATVLATLGARLTPAERVVLGWAGLRGAVPVVLATFPVIAGIPGSLEFFNIVFFAVVLSLLVQGPTFEPLARRLGLTVPGGGEEAPVTELGVIRGLGAELVEYVVGPGHAAAGAYVRDLGLPHEALVSVIVRDGEAIPPRGSMHVEPGDRLHVLVRQEVAREVEALMQRWRTGPLQRPRPLRRRVRGTAPIFTVRPFSRSAVDGDPRSPRVVAGTPVAARLRMRRDTAGALVALEDGRYAVTGPLVMVGSRNDLTAYARRRLAHADEDERAWLQSVVGALAVDAFRDEAHPRFGRAPADGGGGR